MIDFARSDGLEDEYRRCDMSLEDKLSVEIIYCVP
jgi:hypothetical protein